MDRIAASAGVSKRTVYNHFPSKEALFARDPRGRCGNAAPTASTCPIAATARCARSCWNWCSRRLRLLHDANFVDLARVAIAAGVHSPDLARELIARLGGNREEGLTTWVRAAAADGKLKTKDPVFASHAVAGPGQGLRVLAADRHGPAAADRGQQKQVAEAAVEMFLGCYAKA